MKKILLCIIMLTLSGCSARNSEVIQAQKLCASNGGLVSIFPKLLSGIDAYCKNGAKFVIYDTTTKKVE